MRSNLSTALAATYLAVASVWLISCAGHVESDRVEVPYNWLKQFHGKTEKCIAINQKFRNRGERYLGDENVAEDGLLAEMVFSRFLPGGMTSEAVEIVTEIPSSSMTVKLTGNGERELHLQISCNSGWYVLSRSRGEQYLGESVQQRRFEKVSLFRVGEQGELIATVRETAEFNSLYILNSEAEAAGWYRFWPTSARVD